MSSPSTTPIRFEPQPVQDQRVTVFDSSVASEPFLDSVALENLRKRQQAEATKALSTK
ncbi:uncharacterized protein A1O9_06784 [Exophiala aquamarina CBS 119918]|uniref:Uncharacterized protein n=1 Tax=Exophiala aquamarina CBS 119918 TaxID=1182545 RepID=A0A072PM26_9EURO|nr:uncharacterized protein A1O9_06784 [Exophiala aquamarina CBS 119918]KEF56595.1 hypothetical protein A1O9_06784 [Exophiala aquamarina CBS 119918]